MARKTDRNFLADFNTLEIEYLPEKGPEVSSDIQMVYVMGNVAPAGATGQAFVPGYAAPVPVLRHYAAQFFQGPVVGENARIELLALATGGGIWISQVTGSPTQIDTQMFTIAALSGLATTLLPTAANSSAFGDGSDATAVIERGTNAVAPPVNVYRGRTGNNANNWATLMTSQFPVYISPGRVFVARAFIANLGVTWGLEWQEIP